MVCTHIVVLGREYYDLIELGKISKEIIDAWPFCCSPAVLTLL